MLQPLPTLDHRKNRRTPLSHLGRIALHNRQIRTHNLRQINFVHNQQIRPRDTRSSFPRNLVPASHIDHVDDEVGQFARVVGG